MVFDSSDPTFYKGRGDKGQIRDTVKFQKYEV